jgi:hypothetical protein
VLLVSLILVTVFQISVVCESLLLVSLILVTVFQISVVCESLQGEADIALESPDQKTRGFVV